MPQTTSDSWRISFIKTWSAQVGSGLKQVRQQDSEDEDTEKSERDDRMREAELRIGPLTVEALKFDNQVMRALEMLKGYEIFKNLKG